MVSNTNIGIIAGSGILPVEIAQICSQNNKKTIVVALDHNNNFTTIENCVVHNFDIVQINEIIHFLKEHQVQTLVMVGKVLRPDFTSLKLNVNTAKLMAKIIKNKFSGDDQILRIICSFLTEHEFNIISPLDILKLRKNQASINSNKPSKRDIEDIQIGQQILKSLGTLDVGQSVIVCNGYTLGIEAAEGTDALIHRCAQIRTAKKGGVLVKMAKTTQDMCLDVPTIGPDTVVNLAKYNFHGVAIEANRLIVIDVATTQKIAEDNDLFISEF